MIALMRAFWSGEMLDFRGEFYQAGACQMHPRPVQPTIPIVWGGHSDAALKRSPRLAMAGILPKSRWISWLKAWQTTPLL